VGVRVFLQAAGGCASVSDRQNSTPPPKPPAEMLVPTEGFIRAAFHSIQPVVSGSGRASDLLRCAREQTDTES
jgi:hypothetical protein